MAKIEFYEGDVLPLCTHCEEELDSIACVSIGFLTQTVVYVCPYCRKVLSIGTRT
jgi:hypothetical protein